MVFEDMTAKEDLLPLCKDITEKRMWVLLKRQSCLSPIDVGDIATKVKSLFDLENSILGDRGITP